MLQSSHRRLISLYRGVKVMLDGMVILGAGEMEDLVAIWSRFGDGRKRFSV